MSFIPFWKSSSSSVTALRSSNPAVQIRGGDHLTALRAMIRKESKAIPTLA